MQIVKQRFSLFLKQTLLISANQIDWARLRFQFTISSDHFVTTSGILQILQNRL